MAKDDVVKLNVRLPKEVHEILKTLAKYRHHSLNAEIIRCIHCAADDIITEAEEWRRRAKTAGSA